MVTTPNGLEYRRSILELPLRLIANLFFEKDINKLKAKILQPYLRMSGAKCGSSKAMIEHKFTEHINVMTPNALRRQILEAGFLIEKQDFIYLSPLFQRPFQKSRNLTEMLKKLERIVQGTRLNRFTMSGLLFKFRKL